MRVGLFTPGQAFEVVVKQRIEQLKSPCLKLIELVVEEIRQIISSGLLKVVFFLSLARPLVLLC